MSKVNLTKLIIQSSAHRKTTSKLLDKIEDAKKNEKRTEFDKILENLEAKWNLLTTLNEKILSFMDEDGMEEEIIETDEYSLELEICLEELRVLRQTTTSTRQPVQSNEQIPEIAGERESIDHYLRLTINQLNLLTGERSAPRQG